MNKGGLDVSWMTFHNILGEMYMFFSPVTINLQAIKINSIDHSAVFNMGTSQHLDLFVSYKRNQGIGEHNGDFSPVFYPASSVLDSDVSDSASVKNSLI